MNADEPDRASSLFTDSTGLCADSIASYPRNRDDAEGASLGAGLFALGTYEVEQAELRASYQSDDQGEGSDANDKEEASSSSPAYTRRGRILLYHVKASRATDVNDVNGGEQDDPRLEARLVHSTEDEAAILDMCWCVSRAVCVLCVAVMTDKEA